MRDNHNKNLIDRLLRDNQRTNKLRNIKRKKKKKISAAEAAVNLVKKRFCRYIRIHDTRH